MTTWNPIEKKRPLLTKQQMKPGQFGVQVLIWPPYKADGSSDAHVAFYGTRYSDKPDFYLYGRGIEVTHWMPLPPPPTAASAFSRNQKIIWKVGHSRFHGFVMGYSHSGKRVRVKIEHATWGGSRYVAPENLEAA